MEIAHTPLQVTQFTNWHGLCIYSDRRRQFGPARVWGQNKEEALCFVPGPVIGEAMPEIGIRAASEVCGRKFRAFLDDREAENEANGTLKKADRDESLGKCGPQKQRRAKDS